MLAARQGVHGVWGVFRFGGLLVCPVGCLVPVVMHACEAELCTETDLSPCVLFGGDEVREGLADEGEADEVADVVEGDLVQDVDEEFAGERRDGARRRGCVFDLRRRGLDMEAREAGDEVLYREDDDGRGVWSCIWGGGRLCWCGR